MLKYDVASTLNSAVVSTLKSDVVSTLKSDDETTMKMGRYTDVEINAVFQHWKLVVKRRNLKPTLNQRWNNIVCRLEKFHKKTNSEQKNHIFGFAIHFDEVKHWNMNY